MSLRQYVLRQPFDLWCKLGCHPQLMNKVQRIFIECVQKWSEDRGRLPDVSPEDSNADMPQERQEQDAEDAALPDDG